MTEGKKRHLLVNRWVRRSTPSFTPPISRIATAVSCFFPLNMATAEFGSELATVEGVGEVLTDGNNRFPAPGGVKPARYE